MALNNNEAESQAVAVVEEEEDEEQDICEENVEKVSNSIACHGPIYPTYYSCPPPYFPEFMPTIGAPSCLPCHMDPIQTQLAHYEARMRDHAAAFASAAANAAYFAAQLANNIQQQMQMDLSAQVSSSGNYFQPYAPHEVTMQPQHINLKVEMQRMEQCQGDARHGRYKEEHHNKQPISYTNANVDTHTETRQRSRDRQRSQHDESASQPNKRRQKIQPVLQPAVPQPSTSAPLFSIMESSSTSHSPSAGRSAHHHSTSNCHYHQSPFADHQPLFYVPNNSNKRRFSHSYNNSTSSSLNKQDHRGSAMRQSNTRRKEANHQQSAPRLDLTGKTGVMALHELCSKCHWEPPRFVEVVSDASVCNEPNLHRTADSSASHQKSKRKLTASSSATSLSSTATSTTTPLNSREFFINAFLNATIYGSGRGGTKAAARQDAARKALAAILPGITFDINGIVLQMPPAHELLSIALSSATAIQPPDFSRLAIDQQHPETQLERPESPVPSEDSSSVLSIATSSITSAAGPGPSKFQKTVLLSSVTSNNHNNNMYPYHASSGISSASEDDENTYYASRGASVCSSLLHAMWQIDDRIKEPPHYSFEVIAPKSVVISGGNKRSSMEGRSAPLHRSSFSCTASIVVLETRKDKPIEDAPFGEESACVPSSSRYDNDVVSGSDDREATKKSVPVIRTEWLEAVGTGATKREARHAASAKLLALLFPDCSSLVEVIAAAEAARELYAAGKAQAKQNRNHSTLSKIDNTIDQHHTDLTKKIVSNASAVENESCSKAPDTKSTYASSKQSRFELTGSNSNDDSSRKDLIPWSDSLNVENLSISESKAKRAADHDTNSAEKRSHEHENRLIQFPVASNASLSQCYLSHQLQLNKDVDAALRKVNDVDGDFGKFSHGEYDIGKVILRRMLPEDALLVEKLFLNIDGNRYPTFTSIVLQKESVAENPIQEIPVTEMQCKRQHVVILLLCRAVLESIPIACALLTPSFSTKKGSVFQISAIAHKEHLPPRERFIEYLKAFASCMNYELEDPGESFFQNSCRV